MEEDMKAIMPIFDDDSGRPYYLQLYDQIKSAILSREIREGEKLPSLRSLASLSGLSLTTIEQAYNQLLVEGYISSRPHSGYYVNSVAAHADSSVYIENKILLQELSDDNIEIADTSGHFFYDPECFDFNKWKKCMNKVINEYSPALFFESDPRGEAGLRREICKYLYMSRGVSCRPDQIIIGAGTQQITGLLATMLRKMSIENVALETPGYMPVRSIFRDRGFAITSVPVERDGLVIEKLPTNISTSVYVNPSNHNPSGAVMPIGRRYELLNWSNENGSYIIEDDYDSELRYFGRPIPALKSLPGSDRVIYLGSFSSTLFAAVKISYMVLPENIAILSESVINDYSQTCSKLEQLTLALFMETGRYQTHIKKLRKLYSQKLDIVTDTLGEKGADIIDIRNTASGLSIILKVSTTKDNAQLKKDAESIGIPVSSLYEQGLVSLYYTGIPIDSIPGAIGDLITAWRSSD